MSFLRTSAILMGCVDPMKICSEEQIHINIFLYEVQFYSSQDPYQSVNIFLQNFSQSYLIVYLSSLHEALKCLRIRKVHRGS